jgi:hypothetical protein
MMERFWAKVDRNGPDECWLWKGAKNHAGYGKMRWCGGWELAHRIIFMMVHGPIPEGAFICHHCDTPSCVNPNHLFLGSALENNRDTLAKGRRPRRYRKSRRQKMKELYTKCGKLGIVIHM